MWRQAHMMPPAQTNPAQQMPGMNAMDPQARNIGRVEPQMGMSWHALPMPCMCHGMLESRSLPQTAMMHQMATMQLMQPSQIKAPTPYSPSCNVPSLQPILQPILHPIPTANPWELKTIARSTSQWVDPIRAQAPHTAFAPVLHTQPGCIHSCAHTMLSRSIAFCLSLL